MVGHLLLLVGCQALLREQTPTTSRGAVATLRGGAAAPSVEATAAEARQKCASVHY